MLKLQSKWNNVVQGEKRTTCHTIRRRDTPAYFAHVALCKQLRTWRRGNFPKGNARTLKSSPKAFFSFDSREVGM